MVKISIVLAVYNGENDVSKCLMSLREQTYSNIEIICVDDGSTDNTLNILKKHTAEDSRIKVLEQGENRKLLLAIKRGVKEATGDYIMFIDDDDWYEPNACERVAEIIDTKHPDVVYFGAKLVEPMGGTNKEIKASRLDRVKSVDLECTGENTLWLKDIKYKYLWNKAVRASIAKSAYDAMPDVEMTYSSGIYACMMIHYYAKSLVSIKDKLYNYNYMAGISASDNMSVDVFDYYLRCNKISADGFGNFLKEHGTNDDRQIIQYWYDRRIMSAIRVWRDRLSKEDALTGLEILYKYYDAVTLASMLQDDYHKINLSRRKHINKIKKLERQLETEKNKSLISRLFRK